MRDTVYTDRSDATIDRAIRACFPSYNGRKVQLRAASEVALSGTYWDEGSRSAYAACHLGTGKAIQLPRYNPPQFGGPREDPVVKLHLGEAVLEHVIFCGRDLGIHIHIHPETFAPLLPEKIELSLVEKIVLNMTCTLTSRGRKEERERHNFPASAWEEGKAGLLTHGFVRKNGAVTNEGRNAEKQFAKSLSGDYSKLIREWREMH